MAEESAAQDNFCTDPWLQFAAADTALNAVQVQCDNILNLI